MNDPKLFLDIGFVILIVIIGIYDFRFRRIPDRMVIGLFIWALLYLVFPDVVPIGDRITGAGLMFLLPLVICLISPGAFGGGDIKLLGVCGFLLGPKKGFTGFCISILVCGIVCVIGLLTGRLKRTDSFAFGPYICIGMIIANL